MGWRIRKRGFNIYRKNIHRHTNRRILMDNNPIYKFMKENGLTQKDEATFVSEYSNPQKSAELHKFMVNNKLTTKSADDFYNEYFSGSKKKEPTTQGSNEPVQQPGKPSAPSFGQKVMTEALVSGQPVMKGVQKKPVEKKPYQDITYRREELPSETTQMPETPLVKAAKKDFKQTQVKPPVQVKSTPEELEEIQKKTEKVDQTGLVLNNYQSTAEIVTDLESLNEGDVNAVFTRIQRRPDLYAKYSGRTPEQIASFQGYQTRELYEADRDLVYKNYLADLESQKLNHDKAVKKANIVSDQIIKAKVTPESYRNFVKDKTETGMFGQEIAAGPVVDMDAVDREASAIAEKYNLPTDGEAWRLLKNNIKSEVNLEIDRPQAVINFNNDYPELEKKRKELFEGGFQADEAIYARVDSQLTALESQYQEEAKREFGVIDAEYKQKADKLNKEYADYTAQIKEQQESLTALYQSGQIDQMQYEDSWAKLSEGEKTFYENYKREFPDLTQYVVKANEINSKYNRKFELQKQAIASKADAEMQAAFKKYAAEYKEDPEILRQINEAYKASFVKATEQRTAKMGQAAQLSANPFSSFYQSTASSLGGVFKGWGGSFNSRSLELLGESMEQNFMMPKARTEEFSDWVDPQNAILLSGQLVGSMLPSMAASAAVVIGSRGVGLSTAAQLIAGGLAGWSTETVDIVGRSYLDRFERTGGNVVEANLAAQRSLQSQYDIMFTYSLDALPFVGKALRFIPTKVGRVVAGGVAELGTEMAQEYPQNIADENIQAGNEPWTNLNEALKDTKRMKETLISIGPVAILGGASQLGTKSKKSELRDANIAMQQKSALNTALPDQKRQYIQNMVFSKNAKFAKGVIGSLFATGQIDEQTSQDLLVEIERSEKIKESGKSAGLSGSKLNVYGFYSARAEEAERNAAKFGKDPILSENYKQMAKEYRDAGLDFMKGNNPDLLTITYADGSQAIMVPEDANALFSDATALSLLNQKAVSIEAYKEGGQGAKIIEELNARVEAYAQTNRYTEAAKIESPMQALRQSINERVSQLEAEKPDLDAKQKQEEIDRIEQELSESFAAVGAAFEEKEKQKRDEGITNRDAEVEMLQSQRKALGIDDVLAFFSDMKPLVSTMVERMESGQAAPQSGVKAASDYLYAKYKELGAMRSDPNRMMTIAQIESIQAQIEQDLETLAGTPPSQKTEARDQENIPGIPSQVGIGQEPVATQPIQGTSQEAPTAGGVLQAQEEVTPATEAAPEVAPEPTVKPSRRERLAKMFETSDGEIAAEKVASFLGEANIGVEVLDPKSFEEKGKQRNFEGSADGIFLVDNNTGKIYLNKERIKGAEGKTIAFHEGIHPVVNIIRNTNPKLYSAIVDGLKAEAVKNKGVAEAADAVASSEYYQEQGPSAIEDETVVETMARVAAGDIDIDTFEPSFREKFIEFMNKLAKMLGLKAIAVNSPRMEVKRLADQLSKALNEGGKLSDVVGKENVGKFQNTVGAQKRAVSVAKGKESLVKYGLKKGVNTTRKIGEALEKRSRELYGIISREDRSEKALKAISSFMADEVRFFVEEFGENSGKGWYGEKFQKGLDAMAAVFPEMKDDQNARDLFTMLVAITSDGTEVMQNFQQASLAYKNYKETGKMPTAAKAQRAESYLVNFNNIQTLLDKYNGDIQAIKKELLTIGSISELNQQRKAQGLEKLDTKWPASFKVPLAASIFGPKLGMFYANLSGMEQYPTLDRWWSRTFNRYRGTLIPQITRGYNKKGEALGIDRYREIAGLKDASEEEVLAKIVQDHDTYEDKGYKKGTPAEKAANTLYKKLYVELNDAPFGAKDRQFMYDAFIETQKKLKRSGINVTIADIQAILWYFEKNLYKKLGVTKPIQGISYEDAANKTYEKWKNSGGSFNYTIKDSEQGETIDEVDIDEETAPTVQPSKGIKRGSNLVKETYYESGLTEDKNDYVFFHVSSAPEASIRKGIDSTKYTSLRTSRDEKGLQYGVASYYTRPEDGERMVGGEKYAVRVPKGKVYPIDSDPLGYGEKAEAKIPEGTPFRGEAVKREVAEMAKKNGYEMIVGEWSYSRTGKPAGELPEFRADALVPLKPTKEKPESFTSNAEKGMERIPFPSQQSEQAKQELESIASEVRDIMSSKKKFSSKEYQLADSVYMNGQVTENKYEDNEFKRDITPEEYDTMTKVLPKSMQADAARVRGLLFGKKGQASIGIPRSVKQFSDNVSETVDRIKTVTGEDGATLNLDGTNYEDGGLVVPAGSINVAQDDVSAEGLFEFLKDNEGNISSDIFKIGLYRFPDRPEVSYDLNIVIPREYRDVALKFGELAGQESLFDLDTFENIKTGSDGKNPRKFTAQELAEIAKDLSEGRLPKIVSEETVGYRGLPGEYVEDYNGIQYFAENEKYAGVFGKNIVKANISKNKVLDLAKWNKKLKDAGIPDNGMGQPFLTIDQSMFDENRNFTTKGREGTFGKMKRAIGLDEFNKFKEEFDNADVIYGEDAGNAGEMVYAVRNPKAISVAKRGQPSVIKGRGEQLVKGGEVTENDRQIALYAIQNKQGIKTTKADMLRVSKMSADEKIKLIEDAFQDKVKKMNPAFRDPEFISQPGTEANRFYQNAVDAKNRALALVQKPKGQPSMVKRTAAEVQQLMGDSMDAVDQDIADGVDAQTAVEDNITSQDWYGELTPKQKEQFDEIIKDEFGVTPKAPVAKPTGVKATISNIIDNYYKLKDGDRSARAAINEILDTDPKLKYIYDNISKINKQLQDAGVITDKTDGCP
jgi:hypothetical protein